MSTRRVWLALVLAVGVPAAGIGFGAGVLVLDTEPWPPGAATVAAPAGGYDRDEFGGWIDADRDSCDTRDEVLARDAIGATVGPDGCVDHVVIHDPYTGERVDGRAEIDVDHRVALFWAWNHGADTWTRAQRVAFANDETNLLATSDDVNRRKAGHGPAAWRPPDPGAWCDYARGWRSTLAAYELRIGPADDAALTELAVSCPGGNR